MMAVPLVTTSILQHIRHSIMIERLVIIDSADPATFYGVNNSNMQLIRNLFPKLRIAARGQVIKVIGKSTRFKETDGWFMCA